MPDYCRAAEIVALGFVGNTRRTILIGQVKRAPINVDCAEAPT